jgi:hypothetical protein
MGTFQYFLVYTCPAPGIIAEYIPARLGILTKDSWALHIPVNIKNRAISMCFFSCNLFINKFKNFG